MKLLIAADMEGISGVVHSDQVTPGLADYNRFRSLMTADVNAAVSGAVQGGAQEIVVADGHAGGYNILIEDLDPRARLHAGNAAPYAMLQGIANGVNSAMFIGYHARAGTQNAVCDHTWSSRDIAGVLLNERPIGEIGLNALLCGHFGVSVLLISGDLAAAQEAKECVPDISTVVVKKGTSRLSAECLPPVQAQNLIKAGAESAVQRFLEGKYPVPLKIEAPIKLTISFIKTSMADKVSAYPAAVRKDARTIELVFEDMPSAYRGFIAAVNMA